MMREVSHVWSLEKIANSPQCFPLGFIFRGHMSPCFGKTGDTWMILGDKIFH